MGQDRSIENNVGVQNKMDVGLGAYVSEGKIVSPPETEVFPGMDVTYALVLKISRIDRLRRIICDDKNAVRSALQERLYRRLEYAGTGLEKYQRRSETHMELSY
jgi:hypothetical protein